jgi:hypothetical protein
LKFKGFFTDYETEVKDVEESNEDSPLEGEKHQFKKFPELCEQYFPDLWEDKKKYARQIEKRIKEGKFSMECPQGDPERIMDSESKT